MSLTIYEVLCNARYNLENAVFPFQIEMAKEQLANALDAIDNGKTLNDVWEEAQPNAAVPYKPTFTPQNEWVSVEERMPEDDLPEGTNRLQIKVLVAIKAKNGYTVRTQNRIRQEQSWSNKEPFTAWYWKFSHGEVTHWMPLPSPPDRRPPEGEEET